MERRMIKAEIRALEPKKGVVTLRGQAAVFNQLSVDLGGFREKIEPGFFRAVLDFDTRALFDHDSSWVLGRNGRTLRLAESKTGLEVEIDAADNPTNRDRIFSPIERGDVDQMSFAFTVHHEELDGKKGDHWEEVDGELIRTLLPGGAKTLPDVSVVAFPAYEGTDVGRQLPGPWFAEARSRALMFREHHQGGVVTWSADIDLESLRLQAEALTLEI